ncbi:MULTISPECIES: hypothetical protein [Lactococcus]|uniref:DUF3592 domain-containing protein n=2 Tax=Lactococcus TaxID=1357 RepID=A0A387BD45_9LACT|nr:MULTISPECIES: hypothetical protein [Lactococcus]AYG00194.1 hypothetical protein D7I46_03280 [Lactococcus allomyrinae]MCL2113412.1 hypothetical protein [Streptococcaceae bacterium]QDK71149.1 hypothetical protein FLP15_08280 [Lactococcus protaetiae]
MSKTITIIQRILRIITLIVAIAMLGGASFLIGVHQANKNLEKTPVSGKIVYGDDVKAIHEVSYEFEGKHFVRRPLDVYFRKLGDEGDKITVYVVNDHPSRVFTSQRGDDLQDSAALLGGWSLVLFLILFGEHQLIKRMKILEEKTKK